MSTAPLAPLPIRRPGPVPRAPLGAPSRPPTAPATVAAHVERLADLVVRDVPLPPTHLAEAVATLIRAASEAVDGLALRPPGLDAPVVVQHRALGRLASRTAGREIVLDVGTAAALEALLAAGRSGTGPGARPGPCSTSTWSPTIAVA